MFSLQKNGYSLVEVLVAISVLLLALVGPLTIAAKSLQSAYYARQQTTALFLAQEGIEIVVAMRNEAFIEQIRSVTGNLPAAWNWQSDAKIASCFTNDGCNLEVDFTSAGKILSHTAATGFLVRDCGSVSCTMSLDSSTSDRSRFGFTGDPTEYTRVITLRRSGSDVVYIESTVSWPVKLFKGAPQSVVLNSAVYRIYE